MDSYLEIAESVLKQHGGPMTAKQILKIAKEMKIVPTHLHGATQHKTLQARLAEDILSRRWRSAFMRTEPGRFVLRSPNGGSAGSVHQLREFPAPRRSEQLRQFNVLCFQHYNSDNFPSLPTLDALSGNQFIERQNWCYKKLADIWQHPDWSFARIMVVLQRETRTMVHSASSYSEEASRPSNLQSIGFLGFVKEEDANLFSSDPFGITEAAQRTLLEHFFMLSYSGQAIDPAAISFKGVILDRNLGEENSFAVILSYECPIGFDPVRQLGNSSGLKWMGNLETLNDLSDFELLSQRVISGGLLNGDGFETAEIYANHSQGRGAFATSPHCKFK